MLAQVRNWLVTGDRWIPALFIAFFLVLALVQARLVHLAVSTSTGLVTEARPGRPGSGWNVDLSLVPQAGESVPVRVRILDVDGRPVRGANVRVVAERASRYAQMVTVRLREDGNGYAGQLRLPIGGDWAVSVVAERGQVRLTSAHAYDVPAGTTP